MIVFFYNWMPAMKMLISTICVLAASATAPAFAAEGDQWYVIDNGKCETVQKIFGLKPGQQPSSITTQPKYQNVKPYKYQNAVGGRHARLQLGPNIYNFAVGESACNLLLNKPESMPRLMP